MYALRCWAVLVKTLQRAGGEVEKSMIAACKEQGRLSSVLSIASRMREGMADGVQTGSRPADLLGAIRSEVEVKLSDHSRVPSLLTVFSSLTCLDNQQPST